LSELPLSAYCPGFLRRPDGSDKYDHRNLFSPATEASAGHVEPHRTGMVRANLCDLFDTVLTIQRDQIHSALTQSTKLGGIGLNIRNLAVIAAFVVTLCIVTPANGDPKLKTDSLSDEFQNPGRHLALGHYKDKQSSLAFPDKVERGFSLTLGQIKGSEQLHGFRDSVNLSAVPEPATMLLLGSGLAVLAGIIRKRRR